MFNGSVRWLCSMAMFSGYVQWHCSMAMFSGYVQRFCSKALFSDYVQWLCSLVRRLCSIAPFINYVQRPRSANTFNGSVQRLRVAFVLRVRLSISGFCLLAPLACSSGLLFWPALLVCSSGLLFWSALLVCSSGLLFSSAPPAWSPVKEGSSSSLLSGLFVSVLLDNHVHGHSICQFHVLFLFEVYRSAMYRSAHSIEFNKDRA